MGLFSKPLPGAVRSSGYAAPAGYPDEHLIQPSQTDLGDGYAPGMHGTSGGPATWEGNTGDLYQDSHGSYAGQYVPGFHNEAGIQPTATVIAPAVGSENLVAPRDAYGVPGTNRVIRGQGPVTGTSDNQWSGHRARTVAKNVQNPGPVTGGQDVNAAAARAYYSQQASYISQAAAEAALISAV